MLRVAILDRKGFHLEAVTKLIASQPDLEVVSAVSIFDECLEASENADIAIIQDDLSRMVTRRMIEKLRTSHSHLQIIVFGVDDDPTAILDYLEAGARGYALRDDTSERFLNVIRVVANGEAMVGPNIVGPLLDRLTFLNQMIANRFHDGSLGLELTPRQEEVAELLAENQSDEEIGRRLGIEPATVQRHVNSILDAFGVTDRRQVGVLIRVLAHPKDDSQPSPNGTS